MTAPYIIHAKTAGLSLYWNDEKWVSDSADACEYCDIAAAHHGFENIPYAFRSRKDSISITRKDQIDA